MFKKFLKNYFYKTIEKKNVFLLKYFPDNLFIGNLPKMEKAKITIKGKNNVLFCGKNVNLKNSNIVFNGDNSLIFLGSGNYKINIFIYNNSTVYIGERNYFNPANATTSIYASEEKNIFIGNDNLFSFGCSIRNADPHLIYSKNTHERLNYTKSIYIGDHIWFGQNSTILKNSKIHSGSIIAAQGVVANKTILSNSIWGGVPARKIKDECFWQGSCVHGWTKEMTEKNKFHNNDDFIYMQDNTTISFSQIEKELDGLKTAYEKYFYLKGLTNSKNRFSK